MGDRTDTSFKILIDFKMLHHIVNFDNIEHNKYLFS